MGFIEDLQEAISPTGLGAEAPSWKNRISEAAYTPPSGLRITFDFENISYKVTKKTSAFEFPDADGTLVQDHGIGGRRFPVRIFFAGPDCDRNAEVFEAAFAERGDGVLELPFYGRHTVTPFGEITRRDDLKSAANQVIFEVTFFKTIGVIYPENQGDPASEVLSALEVFGEAGSAEFASSIDLGSVSEEKNFLDQYNDLLGKVDSGLGKIAAVQDVVNDEFQDYVDAINNTITTLIDTPLALARTTKNMIQAPARALASISDRLDAYGNLAASIFSAPDAISEPGGPGGKGPKIDSRTGTGNDAQEPNKFHTRNLYAMNFAAGAVLSTLYTGNTGGATSIPSVQKLQNDAVRTDTAGRNSFETAPQVIVAAETLLAQMDALTNWREDNYASMAGDSAEFISTPGNVDFGSAYQALLAAVSLAAGFLIKLSFSLSLEKRIVLDRGRSIIDLVYELYGTVDDKLDFFIDSNDLSGDEILEVPKGRTILYYV
jgi:hypothetical protein